MSYLDRSVVATLLNVRITDKGRELLAKGMKEDDNFDIVKFSFGDSEVNYDVDDTTIEDGAVLSPTVAASDLVYKIYSSGSVPSGTSSVNLSTTNIQMTRNQTDINVSVSTNWPPVQGIFQEDYQWTNLGPLNDYDFKIAKSVDNRVATLTSYSVTGTTTVKVKGMTTGKYATFNLTISN